jgi:hypothetical protein
VGRVCSTADQLLENRLHFVGVYFMYIHFVGGF